MSEDKLSFLDEPDMPDAPAPEPEVEAAEPPAVPRDEKGRFAAVEPVETGEPEPDAPPASAPKAEHTIPVAVVTAEREKRQAAERELAEMRRQVAENQRVMLEFQARQMAPKAPEPEPVQIPDPVQDPEAFVRFMAEQQQRQIQSVMQRQAEERDNEQATISQEIAVEKYGQEAVDAALEAARQSGVVQQFTRGRDRWQRLVQWHQQQQVLGEVGSDLTGYRERIIAEERERIAAEERAKVMAEYRIKPSPSAPPPSLAAAPSTGAPRPSPGSAFDNAFS